MRQFTNIVFTLGITFLTQSVFANGDQLLGSCKLENNSEVVISQNLDSNTFKFQFTDNQSPSQVVFEREVTWLWYEVDASYWKYRNGRSGNGVFSWNFNTHIGHLKYVDGQRNYHYWNFHSCAVNEKAIAYK